MLAVFPLRLLTGNAARTTGVPGTPVFGVTGWRAGPQVQANSSSLSCAVEIGQTEPAGRCAPCHLPGVVRPWKVFATKQLFARHSNIESACGKTGERAPATV